MIVDWLASVSAAHWSIVIAVAFLISLWVWFNRESAENGFDFVDAFKGSDGKASDTKCLEWMFSIIIAWQIMFGVFRGQDMTVLSLGVLGVLVTGKAATSIGSALASRPQPAPSAVNATNSDVTVTPAAAPASGAPVPLGLPPSIRVKG